MRINNNLQAMNTHRQLGISTTQGAKSMEKLSSGFRINRAGDDAAGLAISEKMRGQIRGLNQASRNAQDGISMIQTAEGALGEVHEMAQRMRELIVQANNGTNTPDDLNEIQKEITELNSEITRIAEKTNFNTKNLLDGGLGVKANTATTTAFDAQGISISLNGIAGGETIELSVDGTKVTASHNGVTQEIDNGNANVTAGTVMNFDKIGVKLDFGGNTTLALTVANDIVTEGTQTKFQIGANEGTTMEISIKSMKAEDLGVGIVGADAQSIKDINVITGDFDDNIQVIDKAISEVSAQRSQLGAWQNRLEYTIKNLDTSAENLQAAESRIRDVDMAKEMMEMTKQNILQQASQAMLAQANQAPQGVLQLLR